MPNTTARRTRSRAPRGAASAFFALLASACAAGPGDAEALRPVRFAVIGAPQIGADPLAEDTLLEAVTLLSLEPDLDFALIPGPLLAADADDPAYAREALIGALGSLASPVYAAFGPGDEGEGELLEALELGLAEQPGQLSYAGTPVRGVLPVVLGAEGELPEALELEPGTLSLAVAGGQPGSKTWSLLVRSGDRHGINLGASGVELLVPPLAQPPHVYGVGTWDGSSLSIEWRLAGEGAAPQSPPPIQLSPH